VGVWVGGWVGGWVGVVGVTDKYEHINHIVRMLYTS
jgi:hypothetical protein